MELSEWKYILEEIIQKKKGNQYAYLLDQIDDSSDRERIAKALATADKMKERSKLTSKMRYEVFKRDGFRCVYCGRTASDGVTLHADHIVPIAKGGQTVIDNLQTLCSECNAGKSDDYEE